MPDAAYIIREHSPLARQMETAAAALIDAAEPTCAAMDVEPHERRATPPWSPARASSF
jgi:hypothetical protein